MARGWSARSGRRSPSDAVECSEKASAAAEPPFPVRQLFVLALCRICEPIAFMSIFPYIYHMIQSFNITTDEQQIAVYTGMVTSAFAFAEFATGFLWGRISDAVGRKPILLTGLAGTGLSMIVFGFAQNLQTALIARALGGLLNGNIGVLQTTVAEVVRDERHRPRAFAIMPFVWCLGSIIGASLGGCLADPVASYPHVFARGSVWDRFPFLLPNVVCAAVVVAGLGIGVLFLEETHEHKKERRDAGVELGRKLIAQLWPSSGYRPLDDDAEDASPSAARGSRDHRAVVDEEEQAGRAADDGDYEDDAGCEGQAPTEQRRSGGSAFNGRVCLFVAAYGILAFHTITFEQLMPVELSMKESTAPARLPFWFVGGFGLSTQAIGVVFAVQGVYQMVAQMVVFPAVHARLGSLWTFRTCALAYPLLYVAAPYLVLLGDGPGRMAALMGVLAAKVTLQALAYPATMLLLTGAAPSLLVLGAVNGAAASAASLARAIGPTASGLLAAQGLRLGIEGLPWWASAGVAALGALQSVAVRAPAATAAAAGGELEQDCPTGRASTASDESDDTLVDEKTRGQMHLLPK